MSTQPEAEVTQPTWAVIELMGHVKTAGRLTEEEKFGTKMGRLDVPQPEVPCKPCNGGGRVLPLESGSTCPECGGKGKTGGGFRTEYFGGGSVYRIKLVTEEVARHVAAGATLPVSAWDFPRGIGQVVPVPAMTYDIDDDHMEDDEP